MAGDSKSKKGKLKINEEVFLSTKATYSDLAQRMATLRTNLTNAVDEIRSGWDTAAGDEFFQKYDNEWLANIDNYIAVIGHMSENMQIANQKYGEVYQKADDIKYNCN